jgi:hypothetical protein
VTSLPRNRRETVPSPGRRVAPPLRLVNPGSESRTATVLVDGGDERPTAHLVRVEAGGSATVPLPDCAGRVTVECHLDGERASAVVSVAPAEGEEPILSLLESTILVTR